MKAIKLTRIVLFTLLIFGLLLFSGYQFMVLPLQANIESLEQKIEEETEHFETVSQKDHNEVNDSQLRINQLQEQLPSQPLVDQLILELEKAELASDSLILNMTFGESSAEESSSNAEAVEEGQGQSPAIIPSGVKKVTISMSVESSTYEQLESFLHEIENMKRIIHIDQLTFSGQENSFGQANQTPVVFTIQISAFYYPDGEMAKPGN